MNFFIGGLNKAELTGEIKNLTLIDTQFEQKNSQYEHVFVKTMNDYCSLLDMKNTIFKNPTGLCEKGQITTAEDMSKLVLKIIEYPEILKVWREKKYTIRFNGLNEREMEIESFIIDKDFEQFYNILGGKSGTLYPDVFNLIMLSSDADDQIFLTIIMQTASRKDRFLDSKKLIDLTRAKISNSNHSHITGIKAESFVVYRIKNNLLSLTNHFYDQIYSENSDSKVQPASITKLMTALLVVENITDLDKQFEIKGSDIIDSSGPLVCIGDMISYRDALYALLLPSSNTMATALSRKVGEILFLKQKYIDV